MMEERALCEGLEVLVLWQTAAMEVVELAAQVER
jgi:hypothetical protein